MREVTLLIWGHRVKGQGQLWHFVFRYRLQFLPSHFQPSPVSCQWWEEEPYWFGVTGSKVKVNFGTLCIRPCGHDTDYSFCPITFRCRVWMMMGETLLILGHGIIGQGQLCPPCEGMPPFALSSYFMLWGKKKCVFTVTCWKKLGSVVQKQFFFLNFILYDWIDAE